MREVAISVGEAARDFLGVLARVESSQESATLLRDGRPVARLIPLSKPAATCEELADRWASIPRLTPEEAEAFAADVEKSRNGLSLVDTSWD